MPFPESVIDMLHRRTRLARRRLPEPVWRAVLGEKRFTERGRFTRPRSQRKRIRPRRGRNQCRPEKNSRRTHRQDSPRSDGRRRVFTPEYPKVFADYAKQQREFGDVSVLPTSAFFYGLKVGEEISIHIEEGKILIIRLVSLGAPDKDGRRTLSYELNGMARDTFILDKGVTSQDHCAPQGGPRGSAANSGAHSRTRRDAFRFRSGSKVAKGDKLLMMEAMKMQTTVYATCDGIVDALPIAVGDTVESKDLLLKLRAG